MYRRIMVFIALLLFSVACIRHGTENNREYIQIEGHLINLKGDPSLFKIHYACDSLIIASGFSSTHKLTAYQFKSGICSSYDFLRIGNGPGEVHSVNVKSIQDTLYVVSYTPVGVSEFISIPLSSIKNENNWKRTQEERPLFVGGDFDVTKDGNYLLLGGDFDAQNLIMNFDRRNKTYSPFEFWPRDKYQGSNIAKQMIYISGSSLYTSGNKLLYASGEGRYATIMDCSDIITDEIVLYDEFPKYKMSKDKINPQRLPECQLGFYAYATDSLIYLTPLTGKLENGLYVPDNYKGYPPYFNDVVDVFNWNGDYIATYITDIPFSNMYVNHSENKLYTLSCNIKDMLSEIYVYDLN